jgi:hypothetical protein
MTSPRDREPMLAALAGAAERANRPTAVVVFCAALLLLATIFALWTGRQASAAERAYVSAAGQLARAKAAADDIKRITAERAAGAGQTSVFDPEPRLLSSISNALPADKIQSTEIRFEPNKEEIPGSPLVRQVVTCRSLQKLEIEPVFEWIAAALNAVPGLHITHFSMKPSREGWEITVKFARWELKA